MGLIIFIIFTTMGCKRLKFFEEPFFEVVHRKNLGKTSKKRIDYYPFGMPMPNRNLEGDYRYKYQGQEKDSETGKEAFELRLWDSRIGRWLTTDPARQYFSPYLGMGNNPINMVDPDGAKALWKPDADGNLIAEEGDNAQTLADYLSISVDDAQNMITSQGLLTNDSGFVIQNQTLTLNNVFTQSINASYSTLTVDDPWGSPDPNDYYNCFAACARGTAGSQIRDPEGSSVNFIKFDGILRNESTPTDTGNLIFGKTIIRFADSRNSAVHGAVFYGKSKDGTIYAYSKNGFDYKPTVLKLNSLTNIYGKIQGLKANRSFIQRISDWWNDAPTTFDSGFYNRN